MNKALVMVEHNNQKMSTATAHAFAAALEIDPHPSLVVLGYQCESVAKAAASFPNASQVMVLDNICYEHFLAENTATALAYLMADYTHLFATSSSRGKDILPRVSGLLGIPQVSDITKILSPYLFEHPTFAGNALETIELLTKRCVLTVRSTAFSAVNFSDKACAIVHCDRIYEPIKTRFVKHMVSMSTRPDLANAKIVVAGGRGLQNAENFKLIEELADCLNAALGASRAAVDAGFISNDYQVGQTGKIVAPDLYIAVGISGAIQHVAGMKDSKIIVAINKDEEAPIFQVATYGLVGDLFKLVPQLVAQLKKTS